MNDTPPPYGDLRVPPHNAQAEQALIGAVMLEPSTWDRVADAVDAGDFYRAEHRAIWQAIADLANADKPRDVVLVADALGNAHKLADVGGLEYLAEIDRNTGSAANALHYASIVRDAAKLRGLIKTCTEVADMAWSGDMGALEAAVELFTCPVGGKAGAAVGMADMLRDAVRYLDERFNAEDGALLGVPTGLIKLDERTSGLQRGDLIVLAGRPAMGKSTLAQNIAEHVALNAQHPVLFFSLEMPARQLALRSLSAHGRIKHDLVRHARFRDEEWQRVTSAVAATSNARFYVDDTGGLSIGDMTVRARRLAKQHEGLSLVVVDYLQLLTLGRNAKAENRTQEVTRFSQALKALAKSLDVPVLALSQLNRSLEVYNENSPDKGTAEVITAKFRNGQIGTDRLAFIGKHCRFADLAEGWAPADPVGNKPRGNADYW
jgi:replicative DNA helicase